MDTRPPLPPGGPGNPPAPLSVNKGSRPAPLPPPKDPPDVKGLGIPPLNTRKVGDGDKVSGKLRPPIPADALFAARVTDQPEEK